MDDAPANTPDETLAARLHRLRQGDLDALGDLMVACGSTVRRALTQRIPDRFRAVLDEDDVLQVTYLEAFLRAVDFAGDSEAAFVSWLRSIAEHNLVDAIKELSRGKRPDPLRRIDAPIGSASDPAGRLVAELLASSTTPSRELAHREAVEGLHRALDGLPADYAAALRLYDLEELPMEVVAARMGRSPGAIHMLRLRARERLLGCLGRAPGLESGDRR